MHFGTIHEEDTKVLIIEQLVVGIAAVVFIVKKV